MLCLQRSPHRGYGEMGEKQRGMMLEQEKGVSALCQSVGGREISQDFICSENL